jgi:hypothetical protein
MSIFNISKLADLKKQIQESWKETPVGWEMHVQNVYASYYQLRQNKLNKDDRPQHWRQYLDQ